MNIASKEGMSMSELKNLKGTGIEERVTKKDILEYIKNQKADYRVEPKTEEKTITTPKPLDIPKTEIKKEKTSITQKSVIDYNEEGLKHTRI